MDQALNALGERVDASQIVEQLERAGFPVTACLAFCLCGCNGFVRLVQRFNHWQWEHHPELDRLRESPPPSTKRTKKPRKHAAHHIACPRCWAEPGQPCKGRSGRNNRAAVHHARLTLWRRRTGVLAAIWERTGDWRLLPTDEAIAALREIEATRFQSVTTSEPNATEKRSNEP